MIRPVCLELLSGLLRWFANGEGNLSDSSRRPRPWVAGLLRFLRWRQTISIPRPANGFLSATDGVMFAAREPSRRGSCDFLGTGSRIASPCNEPIRTHEQGAQSKAILGVASHIPDMVAPKAIKRLERRLTAEIQQQAVSISE
jgi:hypothetical protein